MASVLHIERQLRKPHKLPTSPAVPQSAAVASGLAALTLVSTGTAGRNPHVAVVDATLAALTGSATIVSSIQAAVDAALAALSLSADARTSRTATATATLGAASLSAAAMTNLRLSVDATLAALSVTATGVSSRTAALTGSLAALTGSAIAIGLTRAPVVGATLGALTVSADARTSRTAAADATLGAATVSAVAFSSIQAATDASLAALTLSATASTSRTAALNTSLAALTGTADAAAARVATLNAPLATLTLTATAGTGRTAALNTSLAALTASAAASASRTAALDASLAALSLSATGRAGRNATLNTALAALTSAADARSSRTAAATVTLGAASVTAAAVGDGSAAITSFTLVNTSGSTVSTLLSPVLGLQFKKGDIIGWPRFTRNDTSAACVYSQGLRRNWSDGSIKHLSVVVLAPGTLAGGASLQIDVAGGGTQPTTSARTTTELSNALIKMVGVGQVNLSGTWTATLSDGAAGGFIWIDGEAGKGWIADTDFKQSGSAHGQLKCRYYTFLGTDGAGNLAGIRCLPRVWQPLYDHDTPAKNWRAFSSLTIQHGAGPTTISIPWPFAASTFTATGGSETIAAPSSNYAWGSGGGTGCVPVVLTTAGTLPAGLSTGTVYFALQANGSTNLTLGTASGGQGHVTPTTAGSGTHTMTPVMTCLHFGSVFGATADATWNYIQGGGSLAADATLRTQRSDSTYWHSTKTIPPFDLSLAGTVTDSAWSFDWNPVTNALADAAIDDTGSRLDIGETNGWQARWFYNQTAISEKINRSIGLAGALIGYAFRDTATFAPVNVGNAANTYTGFGANVSTTLQYHPGVGSSGFTAPPASNLMQTWSLTTDIWSHVTPFAYWPYLQTGSPEFLDILVETGDGAIFNDFADVNHRSPSLPSPGAKAIVTGLPNQTRAGCWQMRDLGHAAGIVPDTAPDGIAYKSYFGDANTASLAWLNVQVANASAWTAAHGYHLFYTFNASVGRLATVWTDAYLALAVAGSAQLNESADGLAYLANYAAWLQYQTATFGDYNRYHFIDLSFSDDSQTAPVNSDAMYGGVMFASGLSWASGTPGVFTVSGALAGYVVTNGDKFIFTNGAMSHAGNIPSGLSGLTPYYAVGASGSTFRLAASPGGSALALSGSGSADDIQSIAQIAAMTNTTGLIPGAQGENGYAAYVNAAANWGTALGVAGLSHTAADAATRLTASGGYAPTANPTFAMQPSF